MFHSEILQVSDMLTVANTYHKSISKSKPLLLNDLYKITLLEDHEQEIVCKQAGFSVRNNEKPVFSRESEVRKLLWRKKGRFENIRFEIPNKENKKYIKTQITYSTDERSYFDSICKDIKLNMEFIKENEDGVSIYQTPSLVIAFGKETNNKKDLYSISIVRKKQGQ